MAAAQRPPVCSIPLPTSELPPHTSLGVDPNNPQPARPQLRQFLIDMLNYGHQLTHMQLFQPNNRYGPSHKMTGSPSSICHFSTPLPRDHAPTLANLKIANPEIWNGEEAILKDAAQPNTASYSECREHLKTDTLANRKRYERGVTQVSKLLEWDCSNLPPTPSYTDFTASVHTITHRLGTGLVHRHRTFTLLVITACLLAGDGSVNADGDGHVGFIVLQVPLEQAGLPLGREPRSSIHGVYACIDVLIRRSSLDNYNQMHYELCWKHSATSEARGNDADKVMSTRRLKFPGTAARMKQEPVDFLTYVRRKRLLRSIFSFGR